MAARSDVQAVTITADTVALDADGISAAASVGNNAALVIGGALASGGAVALSHGRIVTILSAGNDAGISFTVTGTDVNSDAQTESITATAGTVDFLNTSPSGTSIMGLSSVGDADATRDVVIPSDGVVFDDGIYIEYTVSTFLTMTVFHA